MPHKRMSVKQRAGSWSSFWNGVKNVANKIKDGKYISRGFGAVGDAFGNSTLQNIGKASAQLGLGRRRRRRVGRPRLRGSGAIRAY